MKIKKIIIFVLMLPSILVNATDYNVLISNSKYIVKESSDIVPPIDPSPVNLARIGFNGLVSSNYTASTTYSADTPSGAFDGYLNVESLYEDASQINRGIWLSSSGQTLNQWLSIDFNNNINVTSMKIMNRSEVIPYNRIPKNIIIQKSTDGINFTNVQSYVAENIETQLFNLDSAINTRYLRLLIVDNFGGGYIQIEELEVY